MKRVNYKSEIHEKRTETLGRDVLKIKEKKSGKRRINETFIRFGDTKPNKAKKFATVFFYLLTFAKNVISLFMNRKRN